MKRFVKIACSAILFFFLFGDWDAVAASRIGDGAMVTDTVNHQKSRKKKSSQGKKNDVPVFGDTIADGRVAPVVDTTLFSPPRNQVLPEPMPRKRVRMRRHREETA